MTEITIFLGLVIIVLCSALLIFLSMRSSQVSQDEFEDDLVDGVYDEYDRVITIGLEWPGEKCEK